MMLLFSARLEASDINERNVFDCGHVPQHKKLKKSPRHFYFEQCDEQESLSMDTSVSLPQSNLVKMRQKMSSIKFLLQGKALVNRIYHLDQDLLEIEDPQIKKCVIDVAQLRIEYTSTEERLFPSLPDINWTAYNEEYLFYLKRIQKEQYGEEIKKFIVGELANAYLDFTERSFLKPLEVSNQSSENEYCERNNFDAFNKIKTRKFFNNLFRTEQSVVCNDFITKEKLQLSYKSLLSEYLLIKSVLKKDGQQYAQASLNSLKKSIEDFDER